MSNTEIYESTPRYGRIILFAIASAVAGAALSYVIPHAITTYTLTRAADQKIYQSEIDAGRFSVLVPERFTGTEGRYASFHVKIGVPEGHPPMSTAKLRDEFNRILAVVSEANIVTFDGSGHMPVENAIKVLAIKANPDLTNVTVDRVRPGTIVTTNSPSR